MKLNSIYKQLIINIVLPVIIVLLIVSFFSYKNTKQILDLHNKTEQSFIYDEIKSFVELQFVALSIIEEPLNQKMRSYSNELVNNYFSNTYNIENVNLDDIREKAGIKDNNIDLYVINQNGIVVNTTFREDLYINFFKFSKAHKQYLLNIFKLGKFDSPKFFFENKTKRYKKYSYQPTKDGKYIIEIGLYSKQADKLYEYMIEHLEQIPLKKPNLISVDLFFLAEGKPYPVNLKHQFIPEHLPYIPELKKDNIITVNCKKDTNNINYTYLYLPDLNPQIFSGNIIRIANDKTTQLHFIKKEKIKILLLLLLSVVLVFLLIYFRAKIIVNPIQELIDKTKNIAIGDYSERVIVSGNNEIAVLSDNFNKMVDKIEERNNRIEEQSEFLYQVNRKLNDAYKLLEHQKKIIENKKDDLTASINYAHRIQDSLIPTASDLKSVFEESFVYFLPLDIVSGDFYWFSHIKNKIVIVVADCTGHGVPGAFMSIIGITILQHLVNYERIDDPALILSRLDSGINDLLAFNNFSEQRFEGMDATVCTIDLDTGELKFSGAQRPVIVMRNGKPENYEGSIYSIGEYYDNVQKVFTNTTIKLQEKDIIYMFTDGYTSQFNEQQQKKFNSKRFKKLLTDINYRPLKQHPIILHRTFESWKGETAQIDDVLIVGFKYSKNSTKKGISAKDIIEDNI
jgi:serine phosphatase RsbU (regulator of sigma subunit)